MRVSPADGAGFLGAALIAGAVRLKARRSSAEADAPADVGFMRALHAALRRDLCQLSQAAAHPGNSPSTATVLASWNAFRAQLGNHHPVDDERPRRAA